MTNPNTLPVEAIRGLIDERERYEAWLAALEARRAATPAHVFDRVRSDYDGRLHDVCERLVEHAGPLRDEESALAGRQDEVLRALADRQDELAEVELRMLVGEFAPEDGERRVQETASVVRSLDGDRRAVAEQLGELRALLARASQPMSEATAPATMEAAEPISAPEPTTGTAAPSDGPEARPQPSPWQPSPAPAVRDDDTFVGTGDRLGSLAASLGGSVAQPAVTGGIGQEKSLRCQDCGEMNYPTEWYCERCGGELAAM